MRVLFVDDDSSVLKQADIFLEEEDERLDIEPVGSADEGLKLLDEDGFDAIVSDYQMPEMNGLDFLKTVRTERHDDIPFIIFTGKGREEVAMEALNLGADRYLEKKGDPKSQYGVLAQAIIQEIEHSESRIAFEDSEGRYRRLFETAQDGMLIINANTGEIKDANPYLQGIIGYSKEELLGKKLWEIGTFRHIVENKERFEELVDEGYIRYEDLPLETKSGEEAPVEFVSNTYEAGGEEVVQCNIRDISERKDREEELEESQEILDRAIDEAPFPIMLHAEDGEVIKINEIWTEITGYSPEEISTVSEWVEKAYGDKKEEVMNVIKSLHEERGKTSEGEFEITTKTGEKRIWNFKSANIGELPDGRTLVKSVAMDITERKEIEEYYETIVETSPEAIIISDLEGEIIDFNEKLRELVGYDSEEEVIGKSAFDFIAPEDRERAEKNLEKTFEKGEIRNIEYTFLDSDGNKYPAELSASLIRGSDGSPVSLMAIVKDITDRKERGKELEKMWKSYQELFEKSAEALFVHHAETGEVLDVNQKACEMYGESKEGFKGEKIWEYSLGEHPYTQEEAVKKVRKAREGEIEPFEWRAKKKSGELFWAEVNLKSIELLGEERILASVRDITYRKEREEEIQRERKRFQEIFNNSNDAIYLHKLTEEGMLGEFVEVNDTACEMLGYSREEFLDMTIDDIDSSKGVDEVLEVMEELFDEGDVRFEMIHQAKDGTEIPVEIHSHLFELEGEEVVLSVARDISERMEREKKLEQFKRSVEASNDSIYMLDRDYLYVFASDEHLRRLSEDNRIADEDEKHVVGKKVRDIHPEEGWKVLERNVEKVLETGESRKEEHKSSLTDRWSSRTYSPVRGQGLGEVEGVIIVSKDITERKKAEEREAFLHSLLRHDLKNKANVVRGYLEKVKDFDFPEEAESYLEEALETTIRERDLIEKVRNLRKLEEEDVGEVEIGRMLDQIFNKLEEKASEKGIELELDEVECKVRGGPLLEELFSNLIENSIAHSGCDRIRIMGESDGDECVVSVIDDGEGIPDEKKEKIFKREFKEGEESGFGLGLYLVKRIVDNYDGEIEVKDSENGGARFDIHFQKA